MSTTDHADRTRHAVLHECDHMRLVVRDDEGMWCHLSEDGYLAGECRAGVYRVQAIVGGQHNVHAAVPA